MRAFDLVCAAVAAQRHRHPEDGPRAVAARFAAGEVVLADAAPASPDAELAAGTDVWFYRRPALEPEVPWLPEILYRDERITVVDKPPFFATMPRGAHVTNSLTVWLRRTTGNEEITPAHRLDRLTSGLVLCTNRREYRGDYQELFARGQVHKLYRALTVGASGRRRPGVVRAGDVWRTRIEKTRGILQARQVAGTPNAHTAVAAVHAVPGPLAYRVAERYRLALAPPAAGSEASNDAAGELQDVELHPLTGQTHQLRVHLNAAGAPIVGDPLYPTVQPAGWGEFDRPMLLTSTALEFVDPVAGTRRGWQVPALWERDSPGGGRVYPRNPRF